MKEFDILLQRAFRELEARGISRRESDPPLYRVLRRVGLSMRPPQFQSFRSFAFLMGSLFGVPFGLVGWFAYASALGLSPITWTFLALVAGSTFGVAMADVSERRRRHLRLPAWSELEG